ncbi:hypothetical protein A2U01_0083268, partial [Trifolium medium]|nr:hypothetical protein [Trifolium medium]
MPKNMNGNARLRGSG